jgi:benzoyl-CoA-dihydrodiol lyase
MIDFLTSPDHYKHWKISFNGRIARLALNIKEDGGISEGYEMKLNSYDLGVDIELNDAIQRLRFEHPEIGAVIITSDQDRSFSANIKMLGQSSHSDKVNFCKFTNETRNSIEDASAYSGQSYLCTINGNAAGGGYELALATSHIILVDDGVTSVSLPEVPMLAVLPGTGGLTRVIEKRRVRRDRADFFCTNGDGLRGKKALEWGLVDELASRSDLESATFKKAESLVKLSDRPSSDKGILLKDLERKISNNTLRYRYVTVHYDRDLRSATLTITAPQEIPPNNVEMIHAQGCDFWPIAMARELEDAILHLRFNEPELGTWILKTSGDGQNIAAADQAMYENADHWLIREITLYLKRTFKRLDVSSRSIIALIMPGSCFTGTLMELALCADISYMLDGILLNSDMMPATVRLTNMNFGPLVMCNGLTRIDSRFLSENEKTSRIKDRIGEAESLGIVTFIPDNIDWEDEIRVAIEARASFSPDALTAMEANLRFGGPETMESKIFSRLSAWQNWVFLRKNASNSLQLYGSGKKPKFERERI